MSIRIILLENQISELKEALKSPVYSRELCGIINKVKRSIVKGFYVVQDPMSERDLARAFSIINRKNSFLDRVWMALFKILGVYKTDQSKLENLLKLAKAPRILEEQRTQVRKQRESL